MAPAAARLSKLTLGLEPVTPRPRPGSLTGLVQPGDQGRLLGQTGAPNERAKILRTRFPGDWPAKVAPSQAAALRHHLGPGVPASAARHLLRVQKGAFGAWAANGFGEGRPDFKMGQHLPGFCDWQHQKTKSLLA